VHARVSQAAHAHAIWAMAARANRAVHARATTAMQRFYIGRTNRCKVLQEQNINNHSFLCVVVLTVVMLYVFMLSVFMLSVVILNVIILTVVVSTSRLS
jgi:hypothetical protein